MPSPVFDAEAAAARVVAALLPLADPERAVQASRYLKSDLDFLGVSVPGVRAVVTDALLTLLPGIRRGGLDHERFERYATPMLAEKEFFHLQGHRMGAARGREEKIRPTWPRGRGVTWIRCPA